MHKLSLALQWWMSSTFHFSEKVYWILNYIRTWNSTTGIAIIYVAVFILKGRIEKLEKIQNESFLSFKLSKLSPKAHIKVS